MGAGKSQMYREGDGWVCARQQIPTAMNHGKQGATHDYYNLNDHRTKDTPE
jgi:hypothetical protein